MRYIPGFPDGAKFQMLGGHVEKEKLTRRERKRQARHREMLETAMSIVAKQGLEALTIARLADSLGAAVGAIYRYFPSKDDLLTGLQVQALEDFYESLLTELERVDGWLKGQPESDPRVAAVLNVLTVTGWYLDAVWRAPSRHRLIYTFMSAYQPFLSEEGAKVGGAEAAKILAVVSQNLKATKMQEPSQEEREQVTYSLWASIHGLDHFRKLDRVYPRHLKTTELIPFTQRSLLLGWGIEGQVLDRAFALFAQVRQRPSGSEPSASTGTS